MELQDWDVTCRGLKLSGLTNTAIGDEVCLAFHGWLDNSASFVGLMEEGLNLFALDLAGHGRSDHRVGASYFILEWVLDAVHVMRELEARGAQRFHLIGHSLGAGIAALVAACAPDIQVDSLVLIEGLGPLSTAAEDAPDTLRRALSSQTKPPRKYPSVDPMVKAVQTTRPGISEADARRLVDRVVAGSDEYWFAHDEALKDTSLLRLTEYHVLAFLNQIKCPTLLIKAEDGLAFPEELSKPRILSIENLQIETLPGKHHVHLEDAEAVAALIRSFQSRVA
ncbi:alpha/beta hydrolase [Microvenator marinus]|uniref:Alpha/beta hydrolase n=1 Tax=Microvenator marinus TaxID=2600177 RepID=A0A5B8XLS1_9DELT|nr:alpha/beta hydrolase [Microvenator marinus]QED26650.1 alpha/beta hydrolase [Microvenator marinus]